MRPSWITRPFFVSLVALPLAYGLALAAGGKAAGKTVSQALFLVTLVVEACALVAALYARRVFAPSDPGRRAWTLVVCFWVAQLLAEVRLATLEFGLVAEYADAPTPFTFVYVVVLRYLYVLSDLFVVAALVVVISAYARAGLEFRPLARDWAGIVVLAFVAMVAVILPSRSSQEYDAYLVTFWHLSAVVAVVIAGLALVVRRFAVQMGGGAVARVWNAIAFACAARALLYFANAVLSKFAVAGVDDFSDTYLLWVSTVCWLVAAVAQQAVMRSARTSAEASRGW